MFPLKSDASCVLGFILKTLDGWALAIIYNTCSGADFMDSCRPCTHAPKDWWSKWSDDEWEAYYREESEKKKVKMSPSAGDTTLGANIEQAAESNPGADAPTSGANLEQAAGSNPSGSSWNLKPWSRTLVDVEHEDSQLP